MARKRETDDRSKHAFRAWVRVEDRPVGESRAVDVAPDIGATKTLVHLGCELDRDGLAVSVDPLEEKARRVGFPAAYGLEDLRRGRGRAGRGQTLHTIEATQIGGDHHDAAGTFIAQAFRDLYRRRKERYQKILDSMTIPDRAALDRHFFDCLTVEMGRVPPQEKHWATRFVLDLPEQRPCRLERHSVYMMPQGLPMKKVRCIAMDRVEDGVHPQVMQTASMTEYSSRGD